MSDLEFSQLADRLQLAAQALPFPPTPDLAAGFVSPLRPPRRLLKLAWAMAAMVVLLASLLAVPQVRARVLEFLQIGAIRITIPNSGNEQENFIGKPFSSAGFKSAYRIVLPLLGLEGETTLAEAREMVQFTISLPSYPTDLGEPDRVYVQNAVPNNFVILVWLDESHPSRSELALYILAKGASIVKAEPESIEAVSVNGNPAAFVQGDHYLVLNTASSQGVWVQAPVLIWQIGDLTYRLEANLPLDEMIRIAESIGAE